MRATLLFNPSAGAAEPEEALVAALHGVGWTVALRGQKERLEECLRHRADVVVVAGGDGMVGRVAKRLAATEVPMAIVPVGTVNNVARALGVGVDPMTAISGLAHATERRVDLGAVHEDGHEDLFVEGFGVGIFAYVIAERALRKHKKVERALALLADELEGYSPRRYEILANGRDLSGTYVLAAVMNIRSLGPALDLAPDAKYDDGQLDLVVVRPEECRVLITRLRRAAACGEMSLPAFETTRTKHVLLRSDRVWSHIDDRARVLRGELTIDVRSGAVRVLVPAPGSRL